MVFYKRFLGDYAKDTRGLNLIEHGAYTLLLDHLYATETVIRDEPEAIRICNAVTIEEREAVGKILARFFKSTGHGFTHKRFQKERSTRENWRKWQKTHRDKKPDNPLTGNDLSGQCQGTSHSHSHSQIKPSSQSLVFSPLETSEQIVCYSARRKNRRREQTQFPNDFVLNLTMIAFARKHGIGDPQAEFEAFSDHHHAKGSLFSDWIAAWRTWCRNSLRFRGGNNGQPQKQNKLDRFEQALKRVTGRGSGLAAALHGDAVHEGGIRDHRGGDPVLHGLPGKAN